MWITWGYGVTGGIVTPGFTAPGDEFWWRGRNCVYLVYTYQNQSAGTAGAMQETMTTTATQSSEINRSFAIQCLTHILERTTKLLVAAASGGKWGSIAMIDMRALPEISKQFVEACGMQARTADTTDPLSTSVRAAVRQRRILGDLHAAVSILLVKCAQENVGAGLNDVFRTSLDVHNIHDIAVAFVASFER